MLFSWLFLSFHLRLTLSSPCSWPRGQEPLLCACSHAFSRRVLPVTHTQLNNKGKCVTLSHLLGNPVTVHRDTFREAAGCGQKVTQGPSSMSPRPPLGTEQKRTVASSSLPATALLPLVPELRPSWPQRLSKTDVVVPCRVGFHLPKEHFSNLR